MLPREGGDLMPSLLLVDDSAVARHAVARRLTAEGFQVHEAGSAAEARAIPLDGLAGAIIDVELLDGDGPSLAAELRAARPSLPIAFFTAGASQELVTRSQAFGPVLQKPALDPLVAWARGLLAAAPP
jgi:two-component system sensor histidine kinase TorS